MADLESFREEVRTWLGANAPKSLVGTPGGELEGNWGGRKAKYPNPDEKRWLDVMAERGFTAPDLAEGVRRRRALDATRPRCSPRRWRRAQAAAAARSASASR